MITKLSHSLATYLSQNDGLSEKQNIYAYGIECFLNELISNILLLLCGVIINKTLPLFIWCISFTFIRINLGGFHASSHLKCILLGTFLGICSIFVNPLWGLYYPLAPTICFIFSLLLAIRYAPIIHKNHPIKNSQKQKARKKAIFFIIIESTLAIVLFPIKPDFSSPIFTGILTASAMAGLSIYQQKF